MSNLNIAQTIETRISEPVVIASAKKNGMIHAAVGNSGVVRCKRVKVTRLAKGGYTARFIGSSLLKKTVTVYGTDYIMAVDAQGNGYTGYVGNLFIK